MGKRLIDQIRKSVLDFDLNLKNKTVYTEAATGNFICTSIAAAISGAKVYCITNDSKYGTKEEVSNYLQNTIKLLDETVDIILFDNKDLIPLEEVDIVTNTGFVRPIDKKMIDRLNSKAVLSLMWEPWELRSKEIDVKYCEEKGIRIFGTNENDPRLKTMDYLGFMALYFLLQNKITPMKKVLLLGSKIFLNPIKLRLESNTYSVECISDYSKNFSGNLNNYDAIILCEHVNDILLIGQNGFLNSLTKNLPPLIHICGRVDESVKFINTNSPANFGYMTYTTDFINPKAVIDLHCAGLKVGEGLIKANELGLMGEKLNSYMINNYPALPIKSCLDV